MENFIKKIEIGKIELHKPLCSDLTPIYINISFKNERLSITGDIQGDCTGQIRNSLLKIEKKNSEYSLADIKTLYQIWKRWHLKEGIPKEVLQFLFSLSPEK